MDFPFPDARLQGRGRYPKHRRTLLDETDRRNRHPSGAAGNHRGIFAGNARRTADLPHLRRHSGDRLRHLPQRQRRTASRQPDGQRRRPQEHRIDRRHAVAAGRRDPRPVQPRRVPLAHADRGVPGRHGLEQQPGLRNRRHSLPEKQLPGQPALRPQRRERPRVLLPEGSPRFGRATGLWRRGLHGGVRRFHGDGTGRDGEGPPRRGVGESLRMRPRSLVGRRTRTVDGPCGATRKIYGSCFPDATRW